MLFAMGKYTWARSARAHLLGAGAALTLLTLGRPAAADVSEGFDDVAGLAADGWSLQNLSSPIGTVPTWIEGTGGFASHSGDDSSQIVGNYNNVAGAGTISNWLLTPETALVNGTRISFWTRTVSAPSFPDRLEVRLSTAGASTNVGATATSVGDFTSLLLTVNPTLTTSGYPNVWTRYEMTVSGLAAPTTGRVAFRYFVTNGGPNGINSDNIGIDDVLVTSSVCGNNVIEFGETCDDGNTDGTDACTDACIAAACGDGRVYAGVEECDDGNTASGDACSAVCGECGNGNVGPGEDCDDGNTDGYDGCAATCEQALTCDPAGDTATQNSSLEATFSIGCGNAQPFEWLRMFDLSAHASTEIFGVTFNVTDATLDTPRDVTVNLYAATLPLENANLTFITSATVTVAAGAIGPTTAEFAAPVNIDTNQPLVVGIAVPEPAEPEILRLGLNEAPQIGATYIRACTQAEIVPISVYGASFADDALVMSLELRCGTCGDGAFDENSSEACDDGNADDTDACLATCIEAACGDGLVLAGVEACDDGNTDGGDGCAADCLSDETCGNSVLDAGEDCDDGNTTDGDGCEADCTVTPAPTCGDGTLDAGEACDDGNTTDGDGCEGDCTLTPTEGSCGDGTVDDGEACDDGNTDDGDGCEADCTLTPTEGSCGDGTVDDGEACDDGNTVDGDGCEADCTLTDDPGDPTDGGGGGCGCQSSRNDAPSALVLGVAIALGLRRRRRAA
jgi:uncharacterized protein (TIGR03382 family)